MSGKNFRPEGSQQIVSFSRINEGDMPGGCAASMQKRPDLRPKEGESNVRSFCGSWTEFLAPLSPGFTLRR